MKKLQKGDTIKCHDQEDVKQILKDLDKDGVNATVWDAGKYIIMVTRIQGEDDENTDS